MPRMQTLEEESTCSVRRQGADRGRDFYAGQGGQAAQGFRGTAQPSAGPASSAMVPAGV